MRYICIRIIEISLKSVKPHKIKNLSENEQELSKNSEDNNSSETSSLSRNAEWKEVLNDDAVDMLNSQGEINTYQMSTIEEGSHELSTGLYDENDSSKMIPSTPRNRSYEYGAENKGRRVKALSQNSGHEEDFYEDGTFTGLSFGNSNHIDDDEISALPSIKGIEDILAGNDDIESLCKLVTKYSRGQKRGVEMSDSLKLVLKS